MKHIILSVYFLGLAAVGFDALWGNMLRNGAAGALRDIRASGILPSGDALQTHYTGLASLDRSLIGPVIFYDTLMYQQSAVHRYLLVSVFSTMQATSFGILVSLQTWSIGKRWWWPVL
jgi:hypothetical protein